MASLELGPASAHGLEGGTDAVLTPSNPGPFIIADRTTSSASVTVANAGGLVTDVNVKLNDLGSTFAEDLDIELVAPTGAAVMLMSDNCGPEDFEDIDLTLDDEVTASLPLTSPPACGSGTFKPSNDGAGDPMPTPVTGTTLATFDGINPNGIWTLRMVDDAAGVSHDMEGGFALTILTAPFSLLIPGTGASGPAAPYPSLIPVSGKVGTVTDVNLVLSGVTQQYMEDLDVLLLAPNGTKALVLSDRCAGAFVTNNTYILDDEAPSLFPTTAVCPSGSYRPADTGAPDVFAAPAPRGPYPLGLAAFDGIDPNGNWQLYVSDDESGGNGFFINASTLVITTADLTPPDTTLTSKPRDSTRKKVTIRFTSSEPGAHFECKIDKGKFKPCTSPQKIKGLSVGRHKLQVRAIDAAGNVDPTPAKARWRTKAR